MTAKEYLSQVEIKYKRLMRDIEELEELKSSAMYKANIKEVERVQTSSGAGMADIVNRYIDFEKEVEQEEREYLNFRKEAYKCILPVDECFSVNILYERYFKYKRLDDIAVDSGYSYSQICRMHKQAINIFQQLLVLNTSETKNATKCE